MIQKVKQSDIGHIWRLNESHTPAVNSVTKDWLQSMVDDPRVIFMASIVENNLAAFALALQPGMDYASINYQWFSKSFDNFMYLDRIVVSNDYQRQGLGKALYKALYIKSKGRFERITCEVNLKPLNQQSLDFHYKIGFKEVGQQDTEGGKKKVSLLSWDITAV